MGMFYGKRPPHNKTLPIDALLYRSGRAMFAAGICVCLDDLNRVEDRGAKHLLSAPVHFFPDDGKFSRGSILGTFKCATITLAKPFFISSL